MAPSPSGSSRPRAPPPRKLANQGRNIEDQIRYSYCNPAPGAYDPTYGGTPSDPKPLGKISKTVAPSPLDHEAKQRAHVPGPGSYAAPDTFALPEGGRLNRHAPPERLKIDEYPKPPPGTYGVPHDPSRPRNVNGKFSKDPKVTKFINDEVVRSREIPGPGTHAVLEAFESVKPFFPEGGRCLMAVKPASYFEKAPQLAEGKPGPDRYTLPSALNTNKATGRLVYRYESATIQDTKHIITRTVGEAEAVPGPGHYSLPDPEPLTKPITLKTKAFSHGMPHPFAYNCAPDYARNFITPVRQQNNADKIFGTGVKRGAASASRALRPSEDQGDQGDEVAEIDLNNTAGIFDTDPAEGVVQWRSGGFTSIKKSKSTGAIRSEHPSVLETKKTYPKLAGRNRDNSTFLPMASRRSESLSTHDNSEEYQRLCHGKWQMKAVAEGLQNLTAAALEPLDEVRLREEAILGLRDKAKERMRLEGVSRDQQEQVIAEMLGVLEEKAKASSSSSGGVASSAEAALLSVQT